MLIDPNARYTRSHEWVRADGKQVAVGLSGYAVSQIGRPVYVELSPVGTVVRQGDPFGRIESIKTVVELCAPVGGTIVEINAAVCNNPELLMRDAYDKGRLLYLAPDDTAQLDGLMSDEGYRRFLESDM